MADIAIVAGTVDSVAQITERQKQPNMDGVNDYRWGSNTDESSGIRQYEMGSKENR